MKDNKNSTKMAANNTELTSSPQRATKTKGQTGQNKGKTPKTTNRQGGHPGNEYKTTKIRQTNQNKNGTNFEPIWFKTITKCC